jgi:hypothetical protein
MFGKPEWFEAKKIGWGLRPVTWQGWAYTGAWASAIGVPFVALLANSGFWESLVWMAASIGLLVWDVRQIRRELPGSQKADSPPEDDVLYIGDEEPGQRLATARFDMELRR